MFQGKYFHISNINVMDVIEPTANLFAISCDMSLLYNTDHIVCEANDLHNESCTLNDNISNIYNEWKVN